ncbi:MAG: DUF4252 domain-containing protein [Melioribacteraceae bacterium]|nr:DUF4252 domain-containing protein [Melioribacteraceae bacterium]MCF8265100.1 DUF4252 domain-containing protein [Melioribacteraceae bacterium]MCF8413219.1 DUF4252 domain-containing protein [Melioribacteraceae bacterium]MCF8431186.1 DUF4252 domain-containing protein [Melioribacteraceae bacterium]
MTKMKIKRISLLLLISTVGLFQTGCFGVTSHFKSIRESVAQRVDKDYVKRFEFGIGRSMMSVAGLFIRVAEKNNDESENVDDLFAQIDLIEFSIFEKRDHSRNSPEVKVLDDLIYKLENNHYEYFVKFKDGNELGIVFLRESKDSYDRLLLVTFADENMVIAEMRGNLEGMIDWALKKRTMEVASNN